MNIILNGIIIGASLCVVQVVHAESCSDPSIKEECVMPCPPTPCPPTPCPPTPCKPCPNVCFEPGHPTDPTCTPCAYNLAASYEVGPSDFWVDVSYTYWKAYEEGMDLATVGLLQDENAPRPCNTVLEQNCRFKPGFKIGVGFDVDHDHWGFSGTYSWFRSVSTTHSGMPTSLLVGEPIWILTSLGRNIDGQSIGTTSTFSSKLRIDIDLVDVLLSRPYYQGTHLIITPFGGLRGQWIRQNFRITNPTPADQSGNPVEGAPREYKYSSHSWAVGPRGGFLGKWLLGAGFRFEGDMGFGVLFTRYTKVKVYRDQESDEIRDDLNYSNYEPLRFVNDINLGIGWGDYFDCRNYHFDLLVTYDFQIFWNQNMITKLANLAQSSMNWAPTITNAANLYLQGLTVKARFDF